MAAVSSNRQTLLEQQRALAGFGALALRSDDLDEILTEACRLVSNTLGTALAKVMELQPDGRTLLVRAGVGWRPGVVGRARVRADSTSEGFALDTNEPVISADINTETRFAYPAFLKDNGVKAMVNAIIIGAEGKPPYGILEVDSREPRRFTRDDIAFLETYANLLAAAVDRFQTMQELRELVVEKERLLRELQHRVKNNLQMITALVSTQRRRTASAEAKAELEAIADRIETLRLVHDKLYAAGELQRVDLAPYLAELSGALLKSHSDAAININLRTELQGVCVTPETAVALGMIVNEFVTNSMKYAFEAGRGTVGIKLVAGEDRAPILTLWDDGKGFAETPNGGTGMRLINGLLGQLGATAHWEGHEGARLTIQVPRTAVLS
ncbi:GAF domain-containing protein [Phenylobacterium sp. LjRoot219]|uniref:sensor histidine kinase n=1 Tax=Phenylobacterium sp. LjRoot219 TaxID=3342283 RepID=UPI003ECEDB3D